MRIQARQMEPNQLPVGTYKLTTTLANWTQSSAYGQPYQDLSGRWKLKFFIWGNMNSAARTGIDLTIVGVTFLSGDSQAIAAYNEANIAPYYACTNAGTSTIAIRHANGTTTSYQFSGDVYLDSKPTWLE